MEETPVEDDCVDSGAETGGSDYSPLSSTSINGGDFMADPQDPYLVSVHLIADPDQGGFLQHAADAALSWIHPDLRLFRVSERAHRAKRRPPPPSAQPALAVILFLQESCGGEGHVLSLHRALQRPPWRYHHTEKVSNGRRMLPLAPCSQDFFTLTPGTPLWAVRQVHYGKEIVRFTIYCRHENYADMVRLYKLLLQRRVAQKKEDFCFFVVYSNAELEIQLSFKQLQKGQNPWVLDSALLEVRVRDVGALVPLLPRTCSPISDMRWQTHDYDGNKILLQVQTPFYKLHLDSSFPQLQSTSAPSTFARHSATYRHQQHQQHPRRHPHRSASFHSGRLQTSQTSLPSACDCDRADRRLPTRAATHCGSAFSLPSMSLSRGRRRKHPAKPARPSLAPPFRLNVDALVGAEETDVDTGDRVALDLSVVSAYIQAGLNLNSRPVSAPPEDAVPSRSPAFPDAAERANGLTGSDCGGSLGLLPGRCGRLRLEASATPSVSSASINRSDSCSFDEDKADEDEEEEEEFYI